MFHCLMLHSPVITELLNLVSKGSRTQDTAKSYYDELMQVRLWALKV